MTDALIGLVFLVQAQGEPDWEALSAQADRQRRIERYLDRLDEVIRDRRERTKRLLEQEAERKRRERLR